MNCEKIGEFIKKLRQEHNMSQRDLAEKIPINREAISKWECGRTIPDSSIILRLSEIFNVSTDEILYGEYKIKEDSNDAAKLYLKIYDERNKINRKLKKTSKVLLSLLIVLIVITVSFLLYYFFNSYDSVKIYTIESKEEDIYLTDGIIVLTGENIYFRLGNFNGIDEERIKEVVVYYNDKDNKKLIYKSSSAKDGLIRDYYDYNEYFEIKNKDVIFDSLYVDLHYDDNEMKTLSLSMNENYSNKRIFFKKKKKDFLQDVQYENSEDNDLIKKIKENFKHEENGIYRDEVIMNNTVYELFYVEDTKTLVISWKKDNYRHNISYNPVFKNAYYSKSDNNSVNVDKCIYKEDDANETTCNSETIDIFNFLIQRISKVGS